MAMPGKETETFHELQTQTGWGRTLLRFAEWCAPAPGWLTLDAGCGPGLLPGIFTQMGCKSSGVDIDIEMFRPSPLHSHVAVADIFHLPFGSGQFDLLTSTNVLFLMPDPKLALLEMKRVLRKGGRLAMLNPSEKLDVAAAIAFTTERQLEGTARDTLIGWAGRAEDHHRWTEDETNALYLACGFTAGPCLLSMGPGFARFSSATA